MKAMFRKYKSGEAENRYEASITKTDAAPIMKRLLYCLRTQQKVTGTIGRTAPENLLAIAAPRANPVNISLCQDGLIPLFHKRYSVRTVKTASGMSVVTSMPWPRTFGQNV